MKFREFFIKFDATFNEKCEKEGVSNELNRNKTLVDFRNIPQELVYNFVQKYKQSNGFSN